MKSIISILIATFLVTVFSPLYAGEIIGDNIGPDVSVTAEGKELRWEEGSRDFFIMHKTLLSRSPSGNPNERGGNPQADGAVPQSTYSLVTNSIPDDAEVTDAFIVWVGAQAPDSPNSPYSYNGPTDNTVSLAFTSSEADYSENLDISAPAHVIGDPPSFEFEGVVEESGLEYSGFFTYRQDVTDLFRNILAKGRESGLETDGLAYLGDYTLSGLTCHTGAPQFNHTSLVCGWALFFVYTSADPAMKPKKIYGYNGFRRYRDNEGIIKVSGFEYPEEPTVRATLIVNEGDPGLHDMSLFDHAEGLFVRGEETLPWAPMFNDCNPPKSGYSEIYNSISSFYSWDSSSGSAPVCIGGDPNNPDVNTMEWAMDVDTFMLTPDVFPDHLTTGDTDIEFKVSANQDMVFSNILVVSLDSKTPKFDIPDGASTDLMPAGREKNVCSCSTDDKAFCREQGYYYLIKVQNWGQEIAKGVTVQDSLDPNVKYVPGTTQMATKFDDNGLGSNWSSVPDNEGEFPLDAGVEVAGKMEPCHSSYCEDTVLVRFMVEPKNDIMKNVVISNTVVISDSDGTKYLSNTSVPLKIRQGNCPAEGTCDISSREMKMQCGGVYQQGCQSDSDCDAGYVCGDDNECVEKEKMLTNSGEITVMIGINSPGQDGEDIIIPPTESLVLGQFSMTLEKDADGNVSSDVEKYFEFTAVDLKIDISDNKILLENIQLVYDADDDGKSGEDDVVIATAGEIESEIVTFSVDTGKESFLGGVMHSFIVIADAGYAKETVPGGVTFSSSIQSASSITVSDLGEMTLEMNPIDFASYYLEPSEGYFIVTRGTNEPPAPSVELTNDNIAVLQVRTKSIDGNNTIESMSFSIPGGDYVRFNEGIEAVSVYLDADGDGEVHTADGDVKIAEARTFNTTRGHTFSGLGQHLSFEKGEEKFLIIYVDFAMSAGETGMLMLDAVTLSQDKSILELPVYSRAVTYSCPEQDPDCYLPGAGGEDGCTVTNLDWSGYNVPNLILFSALFLLVAWFVSRLGWRKE